MAKDIVARALALDKSGGGDSYTKAETDALLDGKADLVNGVVPISQIPPAAIEREVPVADDAARFALTTADVQLGDTVRVVETGLMYLVVNTDHLDTEAGYQVYVAGRAAEAVADQYGNTIDTTYAPQSTTYTITEVDTALAEKVDKVTGKGLSTNDFTDTDKAKLDGIESGAEANVQADWAQTDTTADDYIKNKPTIPSPVTVDQTYNAASANAQSGVAVAQAISTKVDKETGKGLSTNDFTDTDKANLTTALETAEAAAPQSTTYTKSEVDTLLADKADLSVFAPMTQAEYDALVTKTAPLYFIYEDGEGS